jgi:hypothetical protein
MFSTDSSHRFKKGQDEKRGAPIFALPAFHQAAFLSMKSFSSAITEPSMMTSSL